MLIVAREDNLKPWRVTSHCPAAEWFPKQSGHSYSRVCKPRERQQNSSSHFCHFDEFCHGHKVPSLEEFKISAQIATSAHTERCVVDLAVFLKGKNGGFTLLPFINY